jgi:anti-sigma B factor antagonist
MSAEPAVVALEGEIDLHQSAQVLARLDPLISARSPIIRVDLAGVTYMDSSGLATMIDAMQRTQAYGGEFVLAAIRPNVMKVFQIARLDQVFRIVA